jgi:hypothetical protein
VVEFNSRTAQQAEDDVWGALQGRSIRTLGWSKPIPGAPKGSPGTPLPIGTYYEGILKEMPSRKQATEYGTNVPKTYQDGNPVMDVHLVLDTQYRDEDPSVEDDGTRRIILNGIGQRALQDEMRRLGIQRFGIGTKIRYELIGLKPNQQGQPSKLVKLTLDPTPYIPVEQRSVEEQLKAAEAQRQPAQQPAQPQQQWATQAQHDAAVASTAAAGVGAQQPAQQPVQQPVQQQGPDLGAAIAAVRQLEAANLTRDLAVQAVVNMPAYKGITAEMLEQGIDSLV